LPIIPEDLVEPLEGGVSILIGTRDAENRPDVARAVGASVSRDRREVTIYLHEIWGARALANLRENGEIAAGFSRPHRPLRDPAQGKVHALRPAERRRAERRRPLPRHVRRAALHGRLPRSITKRFVFWPAVGVTFGVRDIFLQTPGPDAGKRLTAVEAR
jgi:hypothetical protein